MGEVMAVARPDKDRVLALALVGGASQADAGRVAGLSVRTVQRRLQDAEFLGLVQQLRVEAVREIASALKRSAVRSVETLIELQDPTSPPQVRLGAARAVLDHLVRYQRQAEFEDRLRALEMATVLDVQATS